MRIACSGITWNYFARGHGLLAPSLDDVLGEIAQLGYVGSPASVTKPVKETLECFQRHGLTPAPGYFSAAFWDAAQQKDILAEAKQAARASADLGCSELFVAANGFRWVTPGGETRQQRAARVRPEDGLDDAGMRQFAETLNAVGEITLGQGISSCFHNHVGSLIETREEIDRLFALLDPNLVFHGPDLGHLAWAGADPVAYLRDYGQAVRSLHIKDYQAAVRAEGIAAGWDYSGFSEHGIWTEIGQGDIDWPAAFALLQAQAYGGWVIVETDDTQRVSAFESALISRDGLQRLGVWE